jgi:hypothetical protein
MKTNNLVIILIVVLIAAGGIFFISQRKPVTQPNQNSNPVSENKTEEKKTGLFQSIKDAISKSMSLKCEYTDEKSKMIVYIKGTMIRFDGAWRGQNNGTTIMKNNKIWSWNSDKKEGIIIPMQENKDNKQGVNSEQFINDLETQKQHCQVTVVSDSLFKPPADIKFNDLSKLFEKITGTQ